MIVSDELVMYKRQYVLFYSMILLYLKDMVVVVALGNL